MNEINEREANLQRILESAEKLGVEMDEEEALQWLTAIASRQDQDDLVVDEAAGVYGHRITMLDFSPERLAHFRAIGTLVEFNFVRDGKVGYRVETGAEHTVLRRNMAYFWHPVAPDIRSVAYDLSETETCASENNVVQGHCPNTGRRVIREKRSGD